MKNERISILRTAVALALVAQAFQVSAAPTYTLRVPVIGIRSPVLANTDAPSWDVTPGSVDFGSTTIGSYAPDSTLNVHNSGKGSGTLALNAPNGANASDFSASSNCNGIASNGDCTVTVRFKPAATGPRVANLAVGARSVSLSGQGFDPTPSDPYFSYVTSLIHMDGVSGGASFPDVKGNSVTVTGTYTTSTANKVYGTASGYSAGTGGLIVHGSRAIGTADFTLEGWIYLTSLAGPFSIIDGRVTGANGNYPGISYDNGGLQYYVNSAFQISGPALTVNTWNHFAVSRVSGTTRMFLNGHQVGNSWADATNYGGGDFDISANRFAGNNANFVKGYMDDVRITIGVGRYTTNFTVPQVFPDH